MDIEDILSFKPTHTPKRPYGEVADEDEEKRLEKLLKLKKEMWIKKLKEEMERKKNEENNEKETPKEDTLTDKEKEEIQKLIESNDTNENEPFDELALKKLVFLLEKKCYKNQEMRIKFPENPEKFMESEVELYQTIHEFHAVAAVPDLFPVLIKLNVLPTLLQLVSHENTDVSITVLHVLQELTDQDNWMDNKESANTLIDALLELKMIPLLIHNLERLDESVDDEACGVHDTLSIFENLMEQREEISEEVGKQGLFPWLFRRLRVKAPFNENKLFASEILSIMLQYSTENRIVMGDMDGIEVILQQLAYYKRYDPNSFQEEELMHNLFNVICSCLLYEPNKEKFISAEGLQLMNLILREKKASRCGSLKVLNHALSGATGKPNANTFVDILGLRSIFPLFMKTPKKNRKFMNVYQHEENVLAIISSLVKNCRGPQRQRTLSKFLENDLEKVDRLMELHFKYLERVDKADREMAENSPEEKDEEFKYIQRLDTGLFTLQLIDSILLEICASGQPAIKQRVVQTINLRGGSLKTIKHIMREYAGNLGDDGDAEHKETEEQHILQLIDKF